MVDDRELMKFIDDDGPLAPIERLKEPLLSAVLSLVDRGLLIITDHDVPEYLCEMFGLSPLVHHVELTPAGSAWLHAPESAS